jgi:predicted phosphodiesterase
MRLQILSDIHLEFQPDLQLDLVDGIDALIVAGDVCAGTGKGLAYLRQQAGPDLPIVALAGNHEFYGRNWQEARAAAWQHAAAHGITWLDDCVTEIAGVRFAGATLWTDYEIYGSDKRAASMEIAGRIMNDHRLISSRDGDGAQTSFSPARARVAHQVSRAFLATELARPFAGPTVVVTHHGPHIRSIAPKFRDTLLTAAFISDLSDLIEAHEPVLWIHGHTHVNFDYRVGDTRVICNPYGYPGENRRFQPRLVVEV